MKNKLTGYFAVVELSDKTGPEAGGDNIVRPLHHPQTDRDRGYTVDTITQHCMFDSKTPLKPGDQVGNLSTSLLSFTLSPSPCPSLPFPLELLR